MHRNIWTRQRFGDVELALQVAGNEQGPRLVLLHGGLGDAADFSALMPWLLRHFLVLRLEFRGHGASQLGDEPLTYLLHQQDVEAVLAALGWDRVSVVGFSDGGIVGLWLALSGRIAVERLVLIGSHWRLTEQDPALPLLQGLTLEQWTERFPHWLPRYQRRNPAPDAAALVRAVAALWQSPAHYPGERVAALALPTLLVRGDRDPLVALAEQEQLRQRLVDAALFNVPFAGHAAHQDQPRLVCGALRAFFALS